jgi:hypothetical protein
MDLCGQLHLPGAVCNREEPPVHKRISPVWDPELSGTMSDPLERPAQKPSHNNKLTYPTSVNNGVLNISKKSDY